MRAVEDLHLFHRTCRRTIPTSSGRWTLLGVPRMAQPGRMRTRVLVCYATAAGSTAEIAARIAEVIGAAGCDVACRPAPGPDLDLSGTDAVVVGSAVHDMAWLPGGLEVLPRISQSGLPVWCFSVGSVEPRGALTGLLARMEAKQVQAGFPAGFRMRDHRVFRGVLVREGVGWWGLLFYRVVGSRSGDHRNWRGIEEWARRIAGDLTVDSGDQVSLDAPVRKGRSRSAGPER